MDFDIPELNDQDGGNEYIIKKSNPINYHLARMPENFKLPSSSVKDSTKINRNMTVKKQSVAISETKSEMQYLLEDFDEMKKTEENGIQATKYLGKEVSQNQKCLVFHRKDKEITLYGLSSVISFKKDMQLKSSAIDNIKGKRGGRQPGLKALMRGSAKKEEDKEKERDKAKNSDKESDDGGLSSRSWTDNENSDAEENGQKGKGKPTKKDGFLEKDYEKEVPEPPKKSGPTKETKEVKQSTNTKGAENNNSEKQSGADAKDSDADSYSSFDFDS